MSGRLLQLLTIAAVTVMAFPVWARPNSKDSLTATVDITSTADMGSTTLAPGEYKVVAEGNQARFERDGKVIAEIPCTWKTLPNKAPYAEVQMDHSRIMEIDFSGKTQAIEFSSN